MLENIPFQRWLLKKEKTMCVVLKCLRCIYNTEFYEITICFLFLYRSQKELDSGSRENLRSSILPSPKGPKSFSKSRIGLYWTAPSWDESFNFAIASWPFLAYLAKYFRLYSFKCLQLVCSSLFVAAVRFTYVWHDQGKWVTCRRFSILSF